VVRELHNAGSRVGEHRSDRHDSFVDSLGRKFASPVSEVARSRHVLVGNVGDSDPGGDGQDERSHQHALTGRFGLLDHLHYWSRGGLERRVVPGGCCENASFLDRQVDDLAVEAQLRGHLPYCEGWGHSDVHRAVEFDKIGLRTETKRWEDADLHGDEDNVPSIDKQIEARLGNHCLAVDFHVMNLFEFGIGQPPRLGAL